MESSEAAEESCTTRENAPLGCSVGEDDDFSLELLKVVFLASIGRCLRFESPSSDHFTDRCSRDSDSYLKIVECRHSSGRCGEESEKDG